MLANEIEGATSGERLGDLERLGDHLTCVALLAGRGNKAAVPPWSEGASSHSVSIRNHRRTARHVVRELLQKSVILRVLYHRQAPNVYRTSTLDLGR